MIPELELYPLFDGVDAKHLALLRPLFERISFPAGSVVIEQGASADYLYLIEHGRLSISYKPYDGEPIVITRVEEGGLFGWSAVVGSDNYTSSGIAVDDLDAIRIRGNDLRTLCVKHPLAGREILDRLADAVSNRWKDAHKQVKSILKNGMNRKF